MFPTDQGPSGRLPITLVAIGSIVGCGSEPSSPPPPPPPAVAAVELSAPAGVLEAGSTLAMTATAKDAGGATLSGVTIAWASSATAVATVNAGEVRGVSAGEATITASAGGKSGSVQVAVRDTTTPGSVLAGRIQRVRLTLPAGQTYRVDQDLTIEVDSTLTIAGTVAVTRGVNLTLVGKRIEVTGAIGVAPAQPAALRAASGRSAAGAGMFTSVTQNLYTSGTIAFPGAMQFAGSGPNSFILVDGGLIEPVAAPRGTASSRPGEDGYPVDIGSPAAIAAGQGPGRTPGPIEDLLIRGVFARVRGGTGGSGFSVLGRSDATITGNLLFARSGAGGRGGSLVIVANRIDNAGQIEAGRGGDAGGIGFLDLSFVLPRIPLELQDGSGPNGAGENFEAIVGSGGAGGDLSIVATGIVGDGSIRLAAGGRPPFVVVTGGNGSAGGAGGYHDGQLGRVGSSGRATVVPQVAVIPVLGDPTAIVQIEAAANGGASASAAKPGGNGGSIAYQWDPTAPKPIIGLIAAARGGAGFDGCAAVVPTAGGDGGLGGTLDVGDADVTLNASAFNGGSGGRGLFRTGRGGSRGARLTPTPAPLGFDGLDGLNCGPSFLTISPTAISVEVINSANGCGAVDYGGQGVRFTSRLGHDLTIHGTITNQVGNAQATFQNGQTSKTIVVPANGTVAEPIRGNTCLPSNDNQSTIGFSTEDAVTVISSIPLDVRCTLNCFAGGPPASPGRPLER